MTSAQHGLKRFAGAIGFFLGAVLLGTFVCADRAAGQCGPGGPRGTNTACGAGALANNTSGSTDSAFGFDALFTNTSGGANHARVPSLPGRMHRQSYR